MIAAGVNTKALSTYMGLGVPRTALVSGVEGERRNCAAL